MSRSYNLLVLRFGNLEYHDFHINEFKVYFNNLYVINYDDLFQQNGILATEQNIEEFINTNKVNIIFLFVYLNNFELSLEYLNRLREKCFVATWFFDDEVFFDSFNKFYAQIAHAVVTTSYYDRYAYEQLCIPSLLYFGSYRKADYYPVKINRSIDVSFVGIHYLRPERDEYINYLKDNGINVMTYGEGSSNGPLTLAEMKDVFSRTKINLNFTGVAQIAEIKKDNPFLPVIKQNKGRPIEIALTRSFCLSEFAPSMDKVFSIGTEIDVFYDKQELLKKVRYYLAHDKERETIAVNAYRKAVSTYESSIYIGKIIEDLLSLLEKCDDYKKKEVLYLSDSFRANYYRFLKSAMVQKLKQKQPLKCYSLMRDIVNKFGIRTFFYILFR